MSQHSNTLEMPRPLPPGVTSPQTPSEGRFYRGCKYQNTQFCIAQYAINTAGNLSKHALSTTTSPTYYARTCGHPSIVTWKDDECIRVNNCGKTKPPSKDQTAKQQQPRPTSHTPRTYTTCRQGTRYAATPTLSIYYTPPSFV